MESLAPMLGYKFRIVENAGTALSNMLSNKNPWAGSTCGRKKFHPCNQKSSKVEQCSAGNVLYELRCTTCNGLEKEPSSLKDSRELPSIYVGETSRGLMERAGDHHRDYNKNKDDSHMVKCWVAAHPGTSKSTFHQYVIGQYKTTLGRQVAEAVRIQMRSSVLNSVRVFNRGKLTRLLVDHEWNRKVWEESWVLWNRTSSRSPWAKKA